MKHIQIEMKVIVDQVEHCKMLFINPQTITQKEALKILNNQLKILYEDAKIKMNEENI
jgi:hypothetical protein